MNTDEMALRILALLALVAESETADVEAFIDDLGIDDLVLLVAGLADLALKSIAPDVQGPERRAVVCARLRAEIIARQGGGPDAA
ncbi:hypothetical protein [Streptomyces sp. NPDC006863]|uniref:hypothetical protein n=1 Tax=Streptomyces sp. NPDC006863 TaxID=3154779 RepID=UPI0033E46B25